MVAEKKSWDVDSFDINVIWQTINLVKKINLKIINKKMKNYIREHRIKMTKKKYLNEVDKYIEFISKTKETIEQDVRRVYKFLLGSDLPDRPGIMNNQIEENHDDAVLTDTKGGIDLNPTMANMDVEKEGVGFSGFFTDELTISRFKNVHGFTPVIFSVADVKDVLAVIGF